MGNTIGRRLNLSESSTSEDIEEIEKGTSGKGDQENIDRHPTLTSSTAKFISNLEPLPRLDGMQ